MSVTHGELRRPMPTPLAAWRGEASLTPVFWGYGVLLSNALAAGYLNALYRGNVSMQELLLAVFAAYTAWVLVSVWRCAESAREPWRNVARFLTVAWAANTLLVGGFLQLRLITG